MPVTIHPNDLGLKFQRVVGKKKPRDRASAPEATLQKSCEALLEALGLAYLHLPAYLLNAGFSRREDGGAAKWAMVNAAKEVRGFPDLCIFHPDGKHFLAVELKTEIGKLTRSQELWRKAIGTLVIRSFADFEGFIKLWLETPNASNVRRFERE